MQRERILWLTKGIGGLLCTGLGLSLFGEALAQKITGGHWFWLGTASLTVFNFGLCLMFDSHNHQLRLLNLKRLDQ
ncbi:MAG: hypothetical protein HC899_17975 [Leptolyngbyaceae cyanobacterium SM1_4_3]|nr:hypothetical protein [Leptolyngbyaceae cyanobacterium SM1_4_3]NJN04989.1 hypothetical protein [Leptolyngbyaceae cyanobacterium RM1_1_2]